MILTSEAMTEACGIPWPEQLSVAEYSEVYFKSRCCMVWVVQVVQSDCNSTMAWQLQVDKVLQQRCMFWQHHSNSSRAHPAHGEASNLPCKSSWSHTFLQGPLSLLTSDKRSQYIGTFKLPQAFRRSFGLSATCKAPDAVVHWLFIIPIYIIYCNIVLQNITFYILSYCKHNRNNNHAWNIILQTTNNHCSNLAWVTAEQNVSHHDALSSLLNTSTSITSKNLVLGRRRSNAKNLLWWFS